MNAAPPPHAAANSAASTASTARRFMRMIRESATLMPPGFDREIACDVDAPVATAASRRRNF
jgi:hypothetical protein